MIALSGQSTSLTTTAAAAIALVLAFEIGGRSASNDTPALSLHATVTSLPADPSAVASAKAEASAKVGAATTRALSITLLRWSTDGERAPLVAALAAAPSPTPAQPAPPAGGGRAVGRGRGGRGAPPPPPPSPFARLSAAIKAAPTLGYIWTDGVTGYSIKYAWRSPATEDKERIVLVTDRRLDSHAPDWAPVSGAAGDADFTIIELRLDRQGVGEGKTSLTTSVAIDTAANTLALDGYAAAPTSLRVTR